MLIRITHTRCLGTIYIALLSVGMMLMTALWGCEKKKEPIKVGFVGGLTGRLSDLGIEGRDGVILAVEEVNQAGGIRGRPVELITKDDRQDPETAVKVAEDNITNQQVALGILNKLGLHADAVGDGAEAVKALESIPYDLVLMDVQMPVMDGLEATGRIRALEAEAESSRQKEMKAQSSKLKARADSNGLSASSFQLSTRSGPIPIVAMTAHAMQGDRERCLEAGMNDYVTKPVSPRALVEVLEKWLPKKTDECASPRSAERGTRNQGNGDFQLPSSDFTVPSPGLVVWDRAAMLERMMGDEELGRIIVETFLSDIPIQIESLGELLEKEDIAGVRRQAHTIKGAAANVCTEALREVAFEMEQAAAAGNLSSVRADMDRLHTEFDRVKQIMKEVQRR